MNGDPVQVTLVVPFVLLLELGLQARSKPTRFKFLPMYVKLTQLIVSSVKLKPLGLELVDARRGSRAEIIKRTSKPLKVNVLAQIQCSRYWKSAQKTL